VELTEKLRFKYSILLPLIMLVLMWLLHIVESIMETDYYFLGIYPRQVDGILGIILAPFIHRDFAHLIDNSIPFFLLGVALFYFYRGIAGEIFIYIYLFTGILVWLLARPSYHIGVSGIVYGMASFLFFSGVVRNDIRLLSVTLIVVFLYGSLVWGILPLNLEISWESHLFGAFVGLILAVVYRNKGPEKPVYPWNLTDENEEDIENNEENVEESNEIEENTLGEQNDKIPS
jgi:membrane associated rhomboid family serine protease